MKKCLILLAILLTLLVVYEVENVEIDESAVVSNHGNDQYVTSKD